ncbi:hypothetical protein DFA_04914 [Cavenderia fasciculata]|uniref:Uncharacterized protein n=1 Tax=Cavenderia fasciculata TaxID=261658 RepID=F4PMD4_CACFS|nr:uncharacterized protein DFA_04914 [Cavenderia fasciculata]EGG22784.1 hypothetical protein DFA_04914 [Cavenderia fasciculata]|eukprot:XP_004360635.1 hypothetical protein DFA_04914 [Cavenderia fasciculata]
MCTSSSDGSGSDGRLPTFIINRILEIAWKSIDYCTCVIDDQSTRPFRYTLYESSIREKMLTYHPLQYLQHLSYLKRYNASCPLHSLYNQTNYFDNPIYHYKGGMDEINNNTNNSNNNNNNQKPSPVTSSNLFNTYYDNDSVSLDFDLSSYNKSWVSSSNGYTKLSVFSLQRFMDLVQPLESTISPYHLKFNKVTKLELENEYGKITDYTLLAEVMPNVTKLVSHSLLPSRLDLFVKSFKFVDSFDFQRVTLKELDNNATDSNSKLQDMLTSLNQGRPFKKLLLPPHMVDHLVLIDLPTIVKQSLEATCFRISSNLSSETQHFTKLNHIIIYPPLSPLQFDNQSITSDNIKLSSTIKRVTFSGVGFIPSQFFTVNPQIKVVRLVYKLGTFEQLIKLIPEDLANVHTIIILNFNSDLFQNDIEYLNNRGLNFYASLISSKKSFNRKVIIKINQNQNNQNINNNNQINNQKLPNRIIYQIIKECWNGYSRCTCSWDLNRWESLKVEELRSSSIISKFLQMVEQCPLHRYHQVATFLEPIKIQKRQLELSTINKNLFQYISNNLFTSNHLASRDGFENHIDNPYCLLKNVNRLETIFFRDKKEFYQSLADNNRVASSITRYEGYELPPFDPLPKQLTHIKLFSDGSVWLTQMLSHSTLVSLDCSYTSLKLKETDMQSFANLIHLKKLFVNLADSPMLVHLPNTIKQQLEAVSFKPSDQIDESQGMAEQYPNLKSITINRIAGSSILTPIFPPTIVRMCFAHFMVVPEVINKILLANPSITTIKINSSLTITNTILSIPDTIPPTLQTIIISKSRQNQVNQLPTSIERIIDTHHYKYFASTNYQTKFIFTQKRK